MPALVDVFIRVNSLPNFALDVDLDKSIVSPAERLSQSSLTLDCFKMGRFDPIPLYKTGLPGYMLHINYCKIFLHFFFCKI